jgi:hypothetical protein
MRKLSIKIKSDIEWAIQNEEFLFWLQKTGLSVLEIFSVNKWLAINRSIQFYDLNLDELLDTKHITIIANTEDPFTETLCDDKRCIALDGHHDDLLYRPERYVEMLERMN